MRLVVLLVAVTLAGCAEVGPFGEPMRIACRNAQPADADCSYDFGGVMAVARFNETYGLARIRSAVEAEGFSVTISNANAVVAERGSDRLTVEAREGWFGFVLQHDAETVSGLTEDEAIAEGTRMCATGVGAKMDRLLASFESRTGWSRATWEPCRANVGVA